jgi:predicted TPR repeat methyltransferase
MGQTDAARAIFERMLKLNPSDNQGARFNLRRIKKGMSWEEAEAADSV